MQLPMLGIVSQTIDTRGLRSTKRNYDGNKCLDSRRQIKYAPGKTFVSCGELNEAGKIFDEGLGEIRGQIDLETVKRDSFVIQR